MLNRIRTSAGDLLPMALIMLAGIATLNQFQLQVSDWLRHTQWLPIVSIGISMTVCALFGRSRLVFASVCWLALAYLPSSGWLSHFTPQQWQLLAVIPLGCLMWMKDKGFAPVPLSLWLGLWLSATLGLFVLINYVEHLQVLNGLYQWMYQLSPDLSRHLSPVQLVVFLLLLGSGLTRLILHSTPANSLLMTQQLGMILLAFYPQPILIESVLVLVALLAIGVVLLESYGMAFRDELTTIPSRRALQQYVQTLGHSYVVVMSDIDHFKKFNDTWGHDIGDQVLKLVASRLNKVKGGGRAFRYGGEEFTLVFPRRSMAQVLPFVESLRAEIADYDMVIRQNNRPEKKGKKLRNQQSDNPQTTVNVTCSFGAAERTREHSNFEDVLKSADIALYAAKKAGRNCVHS